MVRHVSLRYEFWAQKGCWRVANARFASVYINAAAWDPAELTPSSGSLAVSCLLAQGFTIVLHGLRRAFFQVTVLTQILHCL